MTISKIPKQNSVSKRPCPLLSVDFLLPQCLSFSLMSVFKPVFKSLPNKLPLGFILVHPKILFYGVVKNLALPEQRSLERSLQHDSVLFLPPLTESDQEQDSHCYCRLLLHRKLRLVSWVFMFYLKMCNSVFISDK